MPEAKKFITRYSRDFQGNLQEDPNGSWVLAADAAIRDKRLAEKIDTLQQRLTAADERVDVLEGLLLRTLAYYTESCFPEDLLLEVKVTLKLADGPRQYFYRADGCDAAHPEDARCGCWHDEGSGPLPMGLSNHKLNWRLKPAEGGSDGK